METLCPKWKALTVNCIKNMNHTMTNNTYIPIYIPIYIYIYIYILYHQPTSCFLTWKSNTNPLYNNILVPVISKTIITL